MDRLNVLKQNNIETFIESTRTQLHVIWDKCFYGPHQKQEFTPAFKGMLYLHVVYIFNVI